MVAGQSGVAHLRGMDTRLFRHIQACNEHPDLGRYTPLRFGGEKGDAEQVGYLPPALAARLPALSPHLRATPEGVVLDPALASPAERSAALAELVAKLAAEGVFRPRKELFDVRATPGGPVLAVLDRGAIALLGIPSQGVHLNGLVRRADGLHLWIGWRSRHKPVAPGQLDNIVAGGVPAGLSPRDTLLKEAEEEARMPASLAATAKAAGTVSYVMANPDEGLRRDVLHCFDIELPEDFTPEPGDDEVERFELWPATRVLEAVRDGDRVKFNVNLVLIGLFLREGLVEDPDGRLRQGLDRFR
ncbi:NUDIX hydrolase family protein [Roseomonas gilardii]|uniref:NUDIX hydrolase n=1 Tax=Roseomonas gilardii TaxID=257708 RepID=UPI0021B51B78|nr:DUF4743 domain-containing protein [Roseomonas gilardii]